MKCLSAAKKCAAILLCALLALPVFSSATPVRAEGNDAFFAKTGLHSRTPEEIEDYILSHPYDTVAEMYTSEPVCSDGKYEYGTLDPEYLEQALNALNVCRYIAGLDEVALDEGYNGLAQAGALLCEADSTLAHYHDTRPEGMSDEMFNYGNRGCGSCNLAWSGRTLGNVVIRLWVADTDSYNMSAVGHRRWCLCPTMKKTGFGHVGRYSSMYAFDGEWTFASREDPVVWPAATQPLSIFSSSDMWSVQRNNRYSDSAEVALTRSSDGKVWHFSKEASDGDFFIENSYYGNQPAVIFRPDLGNEKITDDVYHVKVTDGSFSLEYDVNFYTHRHEAGETVEKDRIEPGCTTSGSCLRNSVCSICGKLTGEWTSVIIPATGHIYTSRIDNGNGTWTLCCDVCGERAVLNEKPIVYGDANDDGKVSSTDIVRLKKYFAEFDPDTGTSPVAVSPGADANGDGKISAGDIVRLKKYFSEYDPDANKSIILLGPRNMN